MLSSLVEDNEVLLFLLSFFTVKSMVSLSKCNKNFHSLLEVHVLSFNGINTKFFGNVVKRCYLSGITVFYKDIVNIVANNKFLESISVARTTFLDDDIGKALEANNTIKDLFLSNNCIVSDKAAVSIFEAIAKKKNSCLETIALEGYFSDNISIPLREAIPSLKKVSLMSPYIGEGIVDSFSMKSNKNLEKLFLIVPQNDITTDESLEKPLDLCVTMSLSLSLVEFSPKLTNLQLEGHFEVDDSVLENIISGLPCLKALSIKNANLVSSSYNKFEASLEKTSQLKFINVSHVKKYKMVGVVDAFYDAFCDNFFNGLAKNTSIKFVSISSENKRNVVEHFCSFFHKKKAGLKLARVYVTSNLKTSERYKLMDEKRNGENSHFKVELLKNNLAFF